MSISLALVDDSPADQIILEHLCKAARDPTLVFSAGYRSGEECLANLDGAHVDLLLVDLGMPSICGPELVEALKTKWPGLYIMIWTGSAKEEDLHRCLQARINGYLLKEFPTASATRQLERAASEIVHGSHYWLDVRVLRYLFGRSPAPLPKLSPRELQILTRSRIGMQAKEIAAGLGLSEETVKEYTESARLKCGAKSTQEACFLYRV